MAQRNTQVLEVLLITGKNLKTTGLLPPSAQFLQQQVTHSCTAKAEEEAAGWRSIIAVTAANKYQIII